MDHPAIRQWAARKLADLSAPRQAHSWAVARLAAQWAPRCGISPADAFGAGLAHDLAREWPAAALVAEAARLSWPVDAAERGSPILLHGPVAAAWMAADRMGSPSMRDAVRYHTSAAPSLDTLGQLVFVADALEPGRQYPGVEALREVAAANLADGYRAVLAATLRYLAERGLAPHPRTAAAWRAVNGGEMG